MEATQELKRMAAGRWPEILRALGGLPGELLDGKNHPCPRCGGNDRFRFSNLDGNGSCYCNVCFKADNDGDGLAALQWLRGWDFPTAKTELAKHLGVSLGNGRGTNGNGRLPDHDNATETIVINAADKQTVMPPESPQQKRVRQFFERNRLLLAEYGGLNSAGTDEDRPDDLIHGVVGHGAKCLISGEPKSGKTSVLIDAAVTLTAIEPNKFLGHFPRHDEVASRVVLLNYEMNASLLWQNIELAARSKNVEIEKTKLIVLNRPPELTSDWGKQELEKIIGDLGPVVAAFDSFYAATKGKVDPKQYAMTGGFLTEISDLCREAAFATPIIITHANRDRRADGLASISGSGFAEWASDWLLLRRIGKFDATTGCSKIRLEIGSRAGHGGIYTIDVNEGRPDDPGGRVWEPTVSQSTSDATTTTEATSSTLAPAVAEFLADNGPATKNTLRTRLKRNSAAISSALESLMESGDVEQMQTNKRGQMVTLYRTVDGGQTVD